MSQIMAEFLMKFPSICCWILAVFAVSHVSSTGDELNKQKGDSSAPRYPKIEDDTPTPRGHPTAIARGHNNNISAPMYPRIEESPVPSAPPLPRHQQDLVAQMVLRGGGGGPSDQNRHRPPAGMFAPQQQQNSGYPPPVDSSMVMPGYQPIGGGSIAYHQLQQPAASSAHSAYPRIDTQMPDWRHMGQRPSSHQSALPQQPMYGPPPSAVYNGHSSSSGAFAAGSSHSAALAQLLPTPPMPPPPVPPRPTQRLNNYPLSQQQRNNGLTEEIMTVRVWAQMASEKSDRGLGQLFHPELQQIVTSNFSLWEDYIFFSDMRPPTVKPWSMLLKETMEAAIKGSRPENIATAVKSAARIFDADSADLIEILVTTTNAQKEEMGLYSSDFCKRMKRHPEMLSSPHYKTLMWSLCTVPRDESTFGYSTTKSSQMADTISDYLANEEGGKFGFANNWFNSSAAEEIGKYLAQKNYTELRDLFAQRADLGRRLAEMTTKKPSDHFWQVIYAIYTDVVQGRPKFFARLIEQKLNKLLQANSFNPSYVDAHRDIARILVTRAQIDLPDIVDALQHTKFKAEYAWEWDVKVSGLLNTLTELTESNKMIEWDAEKQERLQAYIQILNLVKRRDWTQRLGEPIAYRV